MYDPEEALKASSRNDPEKRLRSSGIVPENEPTRGKHLLNLQDIHGRGSLDREDVQWQIGMNTYHFNRSFSKKKLIKGQDESPHDAPIPDITKAQFARFLLENPEFSMVPPTPSTAQLFDLITSTPGFENFTRCDMGILFGKEPSAGSRWLSPSSNGAATSGTTDGRARTVRQAMTLMYLALRHLDKPQRRAFLIKWIKSLFREAASRGVMPTDFASANVFTHARGKPSKKSTSKSGKTTNRLSGSDIWLEIAQWDE